MKKRIWFLFVIIGLAIGSGAFLSQRKFNDVDTRIQHLETRQTKLEDNLFKFRKSLEKDLSVENGTKILFRIHGSNTLGDELIPQLAKEYLKRLGAEGEIEFQRHSKYNERILVKADFPGEDQPYGIEIYAGGSSTAFSHLFSQLCDIGMSSRSVLEKDIENTQGSFATLDEEIIALDGIAIAVHAQNPIRELTLAQVEQIFSGQITNWKELGGPTLPIQTFIRDRRSGTRSFFTHTLMNSFQLSNNSKIAHSQSEMQKAIRENPSAVGFLSLPYLNGIHPIALKASPSGIAITPNTFSISSEDYPITRRLYLYSLKSLQNNFAREFLNYAMSESSHDIVQNTGFISLKVRNEDSSNPVALQGNLPSEYRDIAMRAKRLSITLKFSKNQSQLDRRSIGDVIRLVKTLDEINTQVKNVYLVGFSDNKGTPESNYKVSLERAQFIKELLLENSNTLNTEQITTLGLGELKPIASNSTESSRAKNRRVEVWLLSE